MSERKDGGSAANIMLNSAHFTFTQEPDSGDGSEIQQLVVRLEDSGAGLYYVIQTDRWAFDKLEQLVVLLKQADAMIAEGGKDE